MYTIQLTQFEGPLDLLLQLIEERSLDISTISLAEVAEQFLGYLAELEETRPEELADFLVVAAKLLLIKSRTLLPHLDVDDGEVDLEQQLKIYKEYYDASKVIEAMIAKRHYTFARNSSLKIGASERAFRPPQQLTADDLQRSFLTVLRRLKPFLTVPEEVIIRTVNIKQRINDIRERILSEATINFQTLLEQASTRTDIIVTFLALLELVKMRAIAVVQDERFSSIQIARRENEPTPESL